MNARASQTPKNFVTLEKIIIILLQSVWRKLIKKGLKEKLKSDNSYEGLELQLCWLSYESSYNK